jgi:hypothetical protein
VKGLDALVCQAAAHIAAKINNSRTQDQVDFLVKTYGFSEEDIDDAAVEAVIGNEALKALRALRRAEVKVAHVKIHLCSLCLEGAGEVCNTPGCALCRHDSPGFPIDPHLYEILDETVEDGVPKFPIIAERPRVSGKKGAARRGGRR